METAIQINLCGRIIQIMDDAWQKHLAYIETLHNYFITEQDHFEIVNDIESRMAELMQEKMRKAGGCIGEMEMDDIITRIGTVAAFEEWDNEDFDTDNTVNTIYTFCSMDKILSPVLANLN